MRMRNVEPNWTSRARLAPSVVGWSIVSMSEPPLLRAVDAVTVPVLCRISTKGLRFYCDQLGQELLWRNDAVGQAGLRLPESDAELVLSTRLDSRRTGWSRR